jgi:hypothetical protein
VRDEHRMFLQKKEEAKRNTRLIVLMAGMRIFILFICGKRRFMQ